LLTAALVGLAVAAGLLLLIWLGQRRLIYMPAGDRLPPAASMLPGAEDLLFTTDDGLELGGWFVAPAGGAWGAVLVCNGNAGDRSLRVPLAAALRRLGLAVLLFDYRGYGGNPGAPSAAGLALDARAARQALLSRLEIDPERLVYLGESLGAAVAIELAAEHPPAALVLRSPFTSMVEVGRLHYPLLPVGWILQDRFPSLQRIAGIQSPLLILAGSADGVVPAAQSQKLYDAAPGPKHLVHFPGAGHNDAEFRDGDRFITEVLAFLRTALSQPPSGAASPR
jgi:fermentation-respiration switch protein FrsA (DUF1100 family)